MEPLRVCIVATYDLAEEGGVKKHAVHLAAQLRARGDQVDILGPWSGRGNLPQGTYGFRGVVNIRSNGSDNWLGLFASPWRARRTMRDGRYDVVHIMEPLVPSLAWYVTWFARPAVRIATFHAFSENESWWSRVARRLFCAPQLRLFDRAIAVSPAAERFARGAWSRPMALIPNGIDTTLFTPPPDPMTRAPGPLRLLFVGHFRDPRKGLPTLLEAFAQLRARGVDAELDVVGEGARIAAPGVTYHGAIADEQGLARRYRGCDVFIAPSTGMESFGIVLLEAMASARPIVCSDIEGYRHVVGVDGAGARLVPPGQAAPLADALAALAADPAARRRMGEANRAASLRFDWAAVAARVREQYLAALAVRRGQPAQAPTPPDPSAPSTEERAPSTPSMSRSSSPSNVRRAHATANDGITLDSDGGVV